MSTPNPRAEQIFATALEIANPAERRAYLDGTCAGDAQLRQEVESLLAAHQQAGEFLEGPPTVVTSAQARAGLETPLAEKSGDRIGRYKLLEEIGEGGFGVVWMAEQEEPVRRRVALKIIKLGMDTREVVARFEAERQALALMDHPNIARVFDGGATESGRPYFVMELVRGLPITKYCDEQRLSMSERLELFVQVCQAVQHAHQKGVIHRDLKPSNILIAIHDDKPVPKVIDFGIAKATQQRLTEKTLFTRFNQFVGTPAYMSPEQAGLSSLDVDTRSDIYSLGVLLYELLTGRTPFSKEELFGGGYEEICRIIRENEPLKPSTRLSTLSQAERSTIAAQRKIPPEKLGKLVRADLDWVVMKCLEKDRARRYETANGLGMDLKRFLDGEPVVARPPSQLYRLQKLVRRNKIAFGASTAVLVALLFGLGVSTYLLARALAAEREQSRLRQEAEAARQNEAQMRAKAQANEKEAKAEAAKNQQIANSVLDILRKGGTWGTVGQDSKFLPDLLKQITERIDRTLKDQPEVEAELRHVIGKTYSDLGDFPNAQTNLAEAVRLCRAFLGNENAGLAQTLFDCAISFLGTNPDKSEQLSSEALAIRRKIYGGSDLLVADSLGLVGQALVRLRRFREAETALNESHSIKKNLLGDQSLGTAYSLAIIEEFEAERGNFERAEELIRQVITILRKTLGEEHRDTVRSAAELARVLMLRGRYGEAEAEMRRVLTLHRKMFGDSHPLVAELLVDLAWILRGRGDLARAEDSAQEALKSAGRPPGMLPVIHVNLLRCLRTLYWDRKDWTGAARYAKDLLVLGRSSHATSVPEAELSLQNLGDMFYHQNDYAQAEPLYRDVLGSRRDRLAPEHEEVLITTANLARLLSDWGWAERTNAVNRRIRERTREAELLLRECLAIQLRGTNSTHWRTADMQSRLGGALVAVGVSDSSLKPEERLVKFSEAEVLLVKGYDALKQNTEPDATIIREAIERLVRLYEVWETAAPNTGKTGQRDRWAKTLESLSQPSGANP